MLNVLKPDMEAKPLRKPGITRALFFAGSWLVLLLGLLAGFSQGQPKTEGEAWIAPARAARKPNPIPADATSIAQGKELFVLGCLPCHGPSGKGDGPAAAGLERNGVPVRPGNLSNAKLWEQSDGTLFWKLSEGKSPMPAFQETFTETQRWQIVNYVRTLAPKEENKNHVANSEGK